MTRLEKVVTRVSTTKIHGKPVVVDLRPDQQIAVRLLGTQQSYKVTIEQLYHWAEKASVPGIPPRKR